MLIIDTVSTCFGHLYAHLQEKDHVLLHGHRNIKLICHYNLFSQIVCLKKAMTNEYYFA